MADAALFIGWGATARGREQKALQVFSQVLQFYARLQSEGRIESFEPVALEPHGGELTGFLLVRGSSEQLQHLRATEEFISLNNRGTLVVDHLGVVTAHIGEGLERLYADFGTQAADLA